MNIFTVSLIALLFVGAYLIGSIPFGFIIVKKIKGIDIRTEGSGVIGATNVNRLLGKTWGRIVLILDFLKGFFIGTLALFYFGGIPWVAGVALLLVVSGHVFPVFLGFKGGKGVATFIGFTIPIIVFCFGEYLHPWTYGAFAGIALSWWLVHKTRKKMGLSSLFLMALLILYFGVLSALTYFSLYFHLTVFITLTALFVMWNHRENFRRILKGQEPTTDLF